LNTLGGNVLDESHMRTSRAKGSHTFFYPFLAEGSKYLGGICRRIQAKNLQSHPFLNPGLAVKERPETSSFQDISPVFATGLFER